MRRPDVAGPPLLWLVVRREASTRLRMRSFQVMTVIGALVMSGLVLLPGLLSRGPDPPLRVAVTGALALPTQVVSEEVARTPSLQLVAAPADPRAAVADGEIDLWMDVGRQAATSVVAERPSDANNPVVASALQGASIRLRLATSRVASAVAADVFATPAVVRTALDPAADERDTQVPLAYALAVIVYTGILLYGQFIGSGVLEEKSSRVMELLVARVPARTLMTGKVLGIGAAALGQYVVLVAAAGLTGAVNGGFEDTGMTVPIAATFTACLLLGFGFYAALYAGAASLVHRQDELSQVLMPLTLVVLGSLVVGLSSLTAPAGMLAEVLTWVPPFTPIVVLVRFVLGAISTTETVAALALLAVATALSLRVGGRLYRSGVLRYSGRGALTAAVRAARARA